MAPKRPPVFRLLVSPETVTAVESKRIDLVVETRREWTKTQVNDAVVQVGLRHLDEVAQRLLKDDDGQQV